MMRQLQRAKPQRRLFEEEIPAVPVQVQLPSNVQEQLRHALTNWMQTLAKRLQEEGGNE